MLLSRRLSNRQKFCQGMTIKAGKLQLARPLATIPAFPMVVIHRNGGRSNSHPLPISRIPMCLHLEWNVPTHLDLYRLRQTQDSLSSLCPNSYHSTATMDMSIPHRYLRTMYHLPSLHLQTVQTAPLLW